jgi:CheY-like chemotaxis protein
VQSISLDGHTILIVEDEPLIAMDIGAACEAAGAVVLTAASLDAATPLLERDELSAAVLDFGLRHWTARLWRHPGDQLDCSNTLLQAALISASARTNALTRISVDDFSTSQRRCCTYGDAL